MRKRDPLESKNSDHDKWGWRVIVAMECGLANGQCGAKGRNLLPAPARAVLLCLALHCRYTKDRHFPGQRNNVTIVSALTIAELTGLARATVTRALKILV